MTVEELERQAQRLDVVARRKQDFELTFSSPAGQRVLEDLMTFCRANQTIFHPNQRINDVLIGRHEVFLRVWQHLNLPAEQLYSLYTGGKKLDNGDSDNARRSRSPESDTDTDAYTDA